MVQKLRYLLLLLSTVVSAQVWAQTGGIEGVVTDAKGEPLTGASIRVTEGGIFKNGASAGVDGDFLIKPLSAGSYEVEISYIGYVTERVEGITVVNDQNATLNVKLEQPKANTTSGGGGSNTNLAEVEVKVSRYEKPLIEPTSPGDRTILTAKDIEKMAVRDVAAQVSTTAGVLQSGRGSTLNIGGGRGENTVYIIDGVLQTGGRGVQLPPGSVGSISVYSGGLPARYGDATGGVVAITSKGVTSTLQGSVGGEQSVDGYGNTRAYFNLSGPVLSRKDTNGYKRPVLGFTLNGDFQLNKDISPTYFGNYVVKQEVLDRLRAEPLRALTSTTGTTFRNSAEFVTLDDLTLQKRRINAEGRRGTVLGKLDFQLADNINLTAGGQFTINQDRNYSRGASLFSPENIGTTENSTTRGYLRFTQRFANRPDEKDNAISNAFYTVQADYQKELTSAGDPNFKEDIFKYGYIGKFYQDIYKQYIPIQDSVTGKVGIGIPPGIGITDNVRFERSELNPILANYTSVLFDRYGIRPTSIFTGGQNVRSFNGLLNGDAPSGVYSGIFNNVGRPITGFSKQNDDQFSVAIDASVDIKPGKTRHAVEFGLYYQQRTERSYGLSSNISGPNGGSNSLWERARLLTNNQFINNYDLQNPIFVVGGQRYTKEDVLSGRINPSPTDTILYNYLSIDSAQSTFDANLRNKLGLAKNNTDYINVDQLDPSLLSIDMFAPDELFNNGSSFVNYYGYDYAGNLQTGNVSWNDFFTKKDANGKYTRPIGAFRPNYIAGYIQDNFELGKARFNFGVRVDRYDANTKVLKDPYSLYETIKVGGNEALGANKAVIFGENGERQGIPANVGSDYVVYVDNAASRIPRIVGFRNGDDWYDPQGNYVEDPTTLKQYTGGTDPQVFQVKNSTTNRVTDIKDPNYDPNSSFVDYTPQVNVMPRLSMSFPIQDQTLFYAHYDVIVQRPRFGVAPSPLDYYFMSNVTGQPIINNPNLRPEKLVDYEFGFQQAITTKTAITLSLFQKERRDQIQVRPYLYASPQTYYTFGNRDFSTTKGLRVKYDFRRTGPVQFNLAYTFQFAEGTGSGAASSNRGRTDAYQTDGLLSNYIQNSLPNIRQSFALDFDVRHNIVLNLDYRYFENEGPMIFGYRAFQNAGANLIARAISGTPYTRYQDPVTQTIAGTVNGARLPWRYSIDLSLDKDIALPGIGRRINKGGDGTASPAGLSGDGKRAPLIFNVFVNFRNLLNTQQILGVYGFSQDARNNGFLESAQGVTATAAQTNPLSYQTLYGINADNPGFFNLPRQIYLGFRLNF